MAKFCTKCGGQADDTATVCPSCGAPFEAAPAAAPAPAQADPGAQANPNVAAKPDTLMCILSYFGILALIPYLSKKDDDFIQFHAKQGLNIFIIEIIASFGIGFISGLTGLSILSLASTAVSVFALALDIMGIVAATKGERKVLPLMDKVKIIK
ncbi:MAG: DUF4870 domain-containing protein [Bacilli bacterium]|nr:DUF4870 domain-containing protein [Bacilli bacterium]